MHSLCVIFQPAVFRNFHTKSNILVHVCSNRKLLNPVKCKPLTIQQNMFTIPVNFMLHKSETLLPPPHPPFFPTNFDSNHKHSSAQLNLVIVITKHSMLSVLIQCIRTNLTRKSARTADNPACPQIPLCDIQINLRLTMYTSLTTQILSDLI